MSVDLQSIEISLLDKLRILLLQLNLALLQLSLTCHQGLYHLIHRHIPSGSHLLSVLIL